MDLGKMKPVSPLQQNYQMTNASVCNKCHAHAHAAMQFNKGLQRLR